MEQVWKGAALCLTGAVLAAVLKKKTPELALLLALTVVAVVAAVLIRVIDNIVTVMEHIMRLGNLPAELFGPLFKTVGIAMVSRLGSDLCRDAGEGAMASVLEISGSLGAIVVSLPLFEAVWDMLQSVL